MSDHQRARYPCTAFKEQARYVNAFEVCQCGWLEADHASVQPRPSWDAYFSAMARAAAERGTCDRRKVGCVLVVDNAVVATGYNGSVRGQPHCDEAGHDMRTVYSSGVEGAPVATEKVEHCVRTVHAEVNALCQAARRGCAVDGATAYVTDSPCRACAQALANAGVTRVVYGRTYDRMVLSELDAWDVEVVNSGGL